MIRNIPKKIISKKMWNPAIIARLFFATIFVVIIIAGIYILNTPQKRLDEINSFDISQDGRIAVSYYAKDTNGRFRSQLYLSDSKKAYDVLDLARIDQPQGDNTKPVFSPDGTRLAFISHEENVDILFVYDFASKKYSRILERIKPEGRACAGITDIIFSEDGEKISFILNQEWIGNTLTKDEGESGDFSVFETDLNGNATKISNLKKQEKCFPFGLFREDGKVSIKKQRSDIDTNILKKIANGSYTEAKISNDVLYFLKDKNIPTSIQPANPQLWISDINGNEPKKVNITITEE